MTVQSIVFASSIWTRKAAEKWLREHYYLPIKYHKTSNYMRFRMCEPEKKKKYRMKEIDRGVSLVLMV